MKKRDLLIALSFMAPVFTLGAAAGGITVVNDFKNGLYVAQVYKNDAGQFDIKIDGVDGKKQGQIALQPNLQSLLVWTADMSPSGEWGSFQKKSCNSGDHYLVQESDVKKVYGKSTLKVNVEGKDKDKKLVLSYL